jgi:hypothetical protein
MISDNESKERRPSMMESMKEFYAEKSNDQDFNQKVNVALTLLLEMYRVIMGSLLILMVPQGCDDHVCDINENIERTGIIDYVGLTTNFATLAAMCGLYYIEVKRENKMINYLEVNPSKPRDDEAVGEALELLAEDKKNNILSYDHYYCNAGYFSLNFSSITKQSGAAISSKFIPPKLFPKIDIQLIISSAFAESISRSIESMSANRLNKIALPSITGFEARAPKLPNPSIAEPLLITATKFPLVV